MRRLIDPMNPPTGHKEVPMFKLKTLSKASIPSALQKAERYRLLNEPYQAVSICQDILQIDHQNQEALTMLLLAYTDKFSYELYPAFDRAVEVLERLNDRHCKYYYRGIINERRAKAHLDKGGPGSAELAHDWYAKAMNAYEQALEICSPGNEDAALRWNTCARILNENPHLRPTEDRREVEVTDG
jgi:hypothetical protein